MKWELKNKQHLLPKYQWQTFTARDLSENTFTARQLNMTNNTARDLDDKQHLIPYISMTNIYCKRSQWQKIFTARELNGTWHVIHEIYVTTSTCILNHICQPYFICHYIFKWPSSLTLQITISFIRFNKSDKYCLLFSLKRYFSWWVHKALIKITKINKNKFSNVNMCMGIHTNSFPFWVLLIPNRMPIFV